MTNNQLVNRDTEILVYLYHLYTCIPVQLLLHTSASVYLYARTPAHACRCTGAQVYSNTCIQVYRYV